MGAKCVYAALLLMCVITIQCSFEEPQTPSWEISLKYPIVSQNMTMNDLVSENVAVFDYENGLLGLRVEGDLEDVKVGDHLVIQDAERQMQVAVPNMSMARLNADDVDFTFGSLTGQASNSTPANVSVDAFSFKDVQGALTPEQDIEAIEVIEGAARLLYANTLPVDLHDVVFYLVDPSNREIVLISPKIPIIPAGKKDSLTLNIIDKRFNRLSEWYITGSSPGSKGHAVTVAQDLTVELKVDFVDFRVVSVQCRNQTFYMEHHQIVTLEVDPSIQEGLFRSGTLDLAISNEIDLDLDLKITMAEILDRAGEPLVINARVAANNPRRVSVDLAAHKLYLGRLPVKPIDLHFDIVAVGASQQDQVVTISEEDILHLNVRIKDVVFESMWGSFDHFQVRVDSTSQVVAMPAELKNFSGINLADGRMQLDFYNTMETPITIDGLLYGIGETGRSVKVPIVVKVVEGSANKPQLTSLSLGMPERPEILDLMNLPPQLISFSGTAFIGDGLKAGLLTSSSYLKTHYLLETPAILSWNESVLTQDSIRLIIHPLDAPKKVEEKGVIHLRAEETNQLRSFAIVSEIENHLPVSAKVEFQLIDNTADAESRIIAVKAINMPAAPIDRYGRTSAALKNSSTLEFGQECLEKFHNTGKTSRSLAIITKLLINGTQEQRVKVFNGDYLSINAAVEAHVEVGKK